MQVRKEEKKNSDEGRKVKKSESIGLNG